MPVRKRPGQPDLHYAVDDFTDPWKNAPWLVLRHGNGRSAACGTAGCLSRYHMIYHIALHFAARHDGIACREA